MMSVIRKLSKAAEATITKLLKYMVESAESAEPAMTPEIKHATPNKASKKRQR